MHITRDLVFDSPSGVLTRRVHRGAIISDEDGKAALRAAGAVVSDSPAEIVATMKRQLG